MVYPHPAGCTVTGPSHRCDNRGECVEGLVSVLYWSMQFINPKLLTPPGAVFKIPLKRGRAFTTSGLLAGWWVLQGAVGPLARHGPDRLNATLEDHLPLFAMKK